MKSFANIALQRKKVFAFTIFKSKTSTSRKMRYFIHHSAGGELMDDVTSLIATAACCPINDDGTITVKGGDGTDILDSLGIALFNDHKAIARQIL